MVGRPKHRLLLANLHKPIAAGTPRRWHTHAADAGHPQHASSLPLPLLGKKLLEEGIVGQVVPAQTVCKLCRIPIGKAHALRPHQLGHLARVNPPRAMWVSFQTLAPEAGPHGLEQRP